MKIKTILVLRRRNDGEWNLKYKIVDPIFTVPGTRMPCRIDSGLSRTPRYTGKREPSRSTKKKMGRNWRQSISLYRNSTVVGEMRVEKVVFAKPMVEGIPRI